MNDYSGAEATPTVSDVAGHRVPHTTDTTSVWTPERIRAIGPVTTVPIAAAIFGLSRSVAYELIASGRFPVPVLRFGSRYRVPVAAILTALHIPVEPGPPPT